MSPQSKRAISVIDSYENWMHQTWRPAMGWLYMITCAFDFIIFPIAWSASQALLGHTVTQWEPLTLKGAGFYHLAMGAVLGVTAWSRGQEKLAVLNSGILQNPEIWQNSESKPTKNPPKQSSNPSARTVLPENPEEDADANIK